MRILFLDVDGVLNSFSETPWNDMWWEDCTMPFNCNCVGLIDELVDICDLTVVISSTWRKFDKEYQSLLRFLKMLNIKVYDKTPVLNNEERGTEIKAWLTANNHLNIEDFIIIDDDADMGELMGNLIQTDGQKGFTHRDYMKAITMLEGE